MPIVLDKTEPAINRGIKTVGIGKKGSRDLPGDLIKEIMHELAHGKVSPAAKGAFLGALTIKGLSEEERTFAHVLGCGTLTDPVRLVEAVAPEAPPFIKNLCPKILNGETLDQRLSYKLGNFLFSNVPGDGARGLIASVLRMRYETADEYEGLLESLDETFTKPFKTKPPDGEPIIQIAEPFDGVDHSYLVTPLIADFLQQQKFRVVSLAGRNSGPKFGNNLRDIINGLNLKCLQNNEELGGPKQDFGYYINQKDLSPAMDRWVEIRRQIIKRPFLATIEKFVNPARAHIMISSAFHPPYTEKMATISERAGFPGAVVVRNGLEGTLAFPLKRAVKIMCSARQKDGTYLRHEFNFDPAVFLGMDVPVDEKLDNPPLEKNIQLIQTFKKDGKTKNRLFDYRVKASCAGITKAVEWVQHNINGGDSNHVD